MPLYERKGVRDKQTLDEIVETSLKRAGLWDQVKVTFINLYPLRWSAATSLCIARAIAVKPQILMNRSFIGPCSYYAARRDHV